MTRLLWLELRRAQRDGAVLVAVAIHALLLALALVLGLVQARHQDEDHASKLADAEARRAALTEAIDAIDTGVRPAPASWLDPRSPSVVGGDSHGGWTAAAPPAPAGFVAGGGAELRRWDHRVTIRPAASFLATPEIASPDALATGRFDAAFVLVYLLPLLLLGTTYDAVATDRARGALASLVALGVEPRRLAAARILAPAALLAATALGVLVLGWVAATLTLVAPPSPLALLAIAVAVLVYVGLWGAIALAVAAVARPASRCAVLLALIWIATVVAVPAAISSAVRLIHPAPSGVELVLQLRAAEQSVATRREEILSAFYGDHPEMAGHGADVSSWALGAYATGLHLDEHLAPTRAAHRARRVRQGALAATLDFVSPASAFDRVLAEVAGTSAARHEAYVEQVLSYQASLRESIVPPMFRGERLTAGSLAAIPRFTFREEPPAASAARAAHALVPLLALALIASLAATLAWRRPRILPSSSGDRP